MQRSSQDQEPETSLGVGLRLAIGLALMGFALAAASVGFMPQVTSAPRLKQSLANGSTIIVERMPQARYTSVQLIASSRGCEDAPTTHGWRHLLEHILAKGPRRDLDPRLESEGLFLSAETTRDAMRFEITGRADQIGIVLKALAELLTPIECTAQDLEREVRIHEREFLLDPPWRPQLARAWRSQYGSKRLDPQGDLESMRSATPASLEALRLRHFQPSNLVLSIAGPVQIDDAMAQAKAVLSRAARVAGPMPPGGTDQDQGVGAPDPSTRVAPVKGLTTPETTATIAAGMALAARSPGIRLVYTPSGRDGICVLIGPEPEAVQRCVDEVSSDEWSELQLRGRSLGIAWMQGLLSDPSSCAALRGTLLAWNNRASPEAVLDALRQMSNQQFRDAANRFLARTVEDAGQ